MTSLRQQGATVARGDLLPRESNPFFSANAQVLLVNGSHISVFEYASEGDAERDASRVSPNGCFIGSTMITWIGPPHFYRMGRLVVIYAGTAEAVLKPLREVLGRPFAEC